MVEGDLLKRLDGAEKQSNKMDAKMIKHIEENAHIIDAHTAGLASDKIAINALKQDKVN